MAKRQRGPAVASEIAIKDTSAKALREMLQQVNDLNAQLRGAVNALAVALDVPAGWQFDTARMVFTEPVAPPSAPEGADHA